MQGKIPQKKQKIVVIVGPTASGKTSLSVSLGKTLNGEIISADSRQVYRTLDIGTEKITIEEMQGVPHHLIDYIDPVESYAASDFVQEAHAAITAIQNRGHIPLVVGGTFFYIEALLGKKQVPTVPPNTVLRTELETLSNEDLFMRLTALDPVRANTIDRHNPRRLVRALEIVAALGTVPEVATAESPYDAHIIGLSTSPEVLRKRIALRLHHTLEKGLIQETQKVIADGLPEKRLREIGLEYSIVLDYLQGDIAEKNLEKVLTEKVWQYAKRQRTWLKKMENVHWYSPDQSDQILSDIRNFLQR